MRYHRSQHNPTSAPGVGGHWQGGLTRSVQNLNKHLGSFTIAEKYVLHVVVQRTLVSARPFKRMHEEKEKGLVKLHRPACSAFPRLSRGAT